MENSTKDLSSLPHKILIKVREATKFFLPNETVTIKEIGDGNVNYIYRVMGEKSSVIVKYAHPFIRGSRTRALTTDRLRIEAEALETFYQLSGGHTPEIYHYSSHDHLIIMEDLADFTILGQAFLKEEEPNHNVLINFTPPFFGKKLAGFLFNTLIKTSSLMVDSQKKRALAARFTNPAMCKISERLVFTEPYYNFEKKNHFANENSAFIQSQLYKNELLKDKVALLKYHFLTSQEALIHGDLHLGSIFVSSTTFKVFDAEFAFYGPMSYDIGNLLAGLMMVLVITEVIKDPISLTSPPAPTSLETKASLQEIITTLILEFSALYKTNYQILVSDPSLKASSAFKTHFLPQLLQKSAGFCGTEIIRRTVGVAKIPLLNSLQTHPKIAHLERVLLTIGSQLVINYKTFTTPNDFAHFLTGALTPN